jgi:predicted dehydrogenase
MNYEAMYERNRLIEWADAIVVATPTENHASDLNTIPGDMPVFVEKPIIAKRQHLSTTDISLVKMVGYNLRFHSCVKKARGWLAEGAIGKPLWARFTCGQYNDKTDYHRDGVILNWSHELDIALYLLGTAKLLAAATNQKETIADIALVHDNTHCHTTVHLDYVTPWERRGFVIVGQDGSIDVDLVSRQAILRDNKGTMPGIYYGRDTFDGNYLAEARAFLDRLDGKVTDGCTAEEAMKVVNICLEAKEYVRS